MTRQKRQLGTSATKAARQCLRAAEDDRRLGYSSVPPPVTTAAPLRIAKDWLWAVVLVVFLVYQPAWHGGLIWDDAAHVTRPELRSLQGLYRIWFDLGATLQYYPLLHSAFWVEHKLWGDTTLGYHLVNILLHCLAALLVVLILRRLAIPGAVLAGAIFALHPVQVESVAWITEQKNTLSAVFYLSALIVYLKFDQTRQLRWYLGSLALFLLAVLSKTVTATLPGGLLVIFWWQRGRLSWKKDFLPLVPFFLLGAGGGMVTAWWELQINHCTGPDFAFTFVDRLLIAGRAACFCLGKLFWPTHLVFIYPRWHIDSSVWWQYLFPLSMLALLAVLWAIRHRTRAPLTALLFFGGTLFPVLGFFNLYTFRYSLVANHYQYLASLGLIALVSAGVVRLMQRWGLWRRPGGYVLCLGLLAILAGLSFQQSRMYANVETLYRTTIAANPDCWLAHGNLGNVLFRRGRLDEAMAEYRQVLQIKPDHEGAHGNLGNVLLHRGRLDEAMAEYRQVLQIKPDDEVGHNNLGSILFRRGRLNDAIAEFRMALNVNPCYAEAHNNLGNALADSRRLDDAIAEYQKALKIRPELADAHYNLGDALLGSGKFDDAIAEYQEALKIRPDYAQARDSLDMALAQRAGVYKAFAERRDLLRSSPNNSILLNDTAWALATNPNASIRNGEEAVEFAECAVKLSDGQEPAILGTLAAAYAEAGRFPEAVTTAHVALNLAVQQKRQPLIESIKTKITLYEAGKPFRQMSPAPITSSAKP